MTLQRNLQDVRAATLAGDFNGGMQVIGRVGVAASSALPTAAGAARGRVLPAEVRRVMCSPTATATQRSAAAQQIALTIGALVGTTTQVLVLDRHLGVLAHVPVDVTTDQIPRLSSAPIEVAFGGGTPAAEVVDGPSGRELIAAHGIYPGAAANGDSCAVAQLSTSTDATDTVLTRTVRLITVGSVAVLALALIAGLVLTGRTLGPLRRLTDTARRLAGGDLRARSGLVPRDDEVGTLATTFDDMAERIEASFAERAENEARMRRFIADASHELRTPITALKGYIEVLQRGVSREPEALDAALGAMARESERMRVLVLDLLTLARLDAAPTPPATPVSLNEVVAGVLDDGVPGMPVLLGRNLATPPAVVLADRGSLITIARNLLVNSCKYAPGARQVWTTTVEGSRGLLRVHDEGPGIAAHDLPHVFERFYRGERSRAREEGGSGLGLSIVQGLARAMGGEVTLESTEGMGTTVTVSLPLAGRPVAASQSAPATVAVEAGAQGRATTTRT